MSNEEKFLEPDSFERYKYLFPLSDRDIAILLAYDRGYRVNENGELFNPLNKKLNPTLCSEGYARFNLRVGKRSVGKTLHFAVHRLVAVQKFGFDFLKDKLIQVRHLNNNQKDNRPCNIGIGYASENAMDKTSETRKRTAKMALAGRKDLIPEHIREEIKRDRAAGLSYNNLIEKYKIAKSTLSYYFNPKNGIFA